MGMDNTSHPGRPRSDELVPSRYALRIREIDAIPAVPIHRPCGD